MIAMLDEKTRVALMHQVETAPTLVYILGALARAMQQSENRNDRIMAQAIFNCFADLLERVSSDVKQ